MKKILAFLMVLTMALFAVACTPASEPTTTPTPNATNTDVTPDGTTPAPTPSTLTVFAMKGPTGIGMIKLLSDSDEGKTTNKYNYTIAGTADEIATKLLKGDLDIAAVPCNLASVLYNKSEGEIFTLAINTLGVLYIVEAGENITAVGDLKDKTIYSTGQGTTPEYTLRFLLSSAGLDPDKDVNSRIALL